MEIVQVIKDTFLTVQSYPAFLDLPCRYAALSLIGLGYEFATLTRLCPEIHHVTVRAGAKCSSGCNVTARGKPTEHKTETGLYVTLRVGIILTPCENCVKIQRGLESHAIKKG